MKIVQRRPTKKDQVRLVIKNLQPIYQEKLIFRAINTFAELFDVGTKIEDALMDGMIKREELSENKVRRPTYSLGGHQPNHFGVTDVNTFSQSNDQSSRGYQGKSRNREESYR